MNTDMTCRTLILSGRLSELKVALKAIKLGLARTTVNMLVLAFLKLDRLEEALTTARRGKASPSAIGEIVVKALTIKYPSKEKDRMSWQQRRAWYVAMHAACLNCPPSVRIRAFKHFSQRGWIDYAVKIASNGKLPRKFLNDLLEESVRHGRMRAAKRAAKLLGKELTAEQLLTCGRKIINQAGWLDDNDYAAIRQSGISSSEIEKTVLRYLRKENYQAAFSLAQIGVSAEVAEKVIIPAMQINDAWVSTLAPMVQSPEVLECVLDHYLKKCWCESAQEIAARLGRNLTTEECERGIKQTIKDGHMNCLVPFVKAAGRQLTQSELLELLTVQCKTGMLTEDKFQTIRLLADDREGYEIMLTNAINKRHVDEVQLCLSRLGRQLTDGEQKQLAVNLGDETLFLDAKNIGYVLEILGIEAVTLRKQLVAKGRWWLVKEVIRITGSRLTDEERETMIAALIRSGYPDSLKYIKEFAGRSLTVSEIKQAVDVASKGDNDYYPREIIRLFC